MSFKNQKMYVTLISLIAAVVVVGCGSNGAGSGGNLGPASTYDDPTPANLTAAASDMETAYTTDVTLWGSETATWVLQIAQELVVANGRLLAQTAATLDANAITQP